MIICLTVLFGSVVLLLVILAGSRKRISALEDWGEVNEWSPGVMCPECERVCFAYKSDLRFLARDFCVCGTSKYDFHHGEVRLAPPDNPNRYEFRYL